MQGFGQADFTRDAPDETIRQVYVELTELWVIIWKAYKHYLGLRGLVFS